LSNAPAPAIILAYRGRYGLPESDISGAIVPVLRSRSAILTLYGDYLLNRGGDISIASLITLLGNFGLSAQAVRSAVSRMCRGGILRVGRRHGGSYYSLADSGYQLLNKGAVRIFQRKNERWDGTWNIISYSIPERMRHARDRLRLELGWFGYGPLSEATWISPYDLTAEVEELSGRLGVREYVLSFRVRHHGATQPTDIVARSWDLDRIHRKYAGFIAEYRPRLERHAERLRQGETIAASECFVDRFNLIHEYRRLPYLDPDLPEELLPADWLRPQAAALFRDYHDLLAEKAIAYFESVFGAIP
jgi:phenylacetic acid degradation operon negative regulatory protein